MARPEVMRYSTLLQSALSSSCLSELPSDVLSNVLRQMDSRSLQMLSATSASARREWVRVQEQRMRRQPTHVSRLPLHMRRAFLRPSPVPSQTCRHRRVEECLAPGDVISAAEWCGNWHMLLASNGVLWASQIIGSAIWRIRVPGADPDREAVVLAMSADSEHVAVIRDDGALLVAGVGPGSLASPQDAPLPVDPTQLRFERAVELGDERAVQVYVGQSWTYALTRAGSIWAWGVMDDFFWGFRSSDWDREEDSAQEIDRPKRITELFDGTSPPGFALLSVCDEMLCAVDLRGRVYACGNAVETSDGSYLGMLVELPGPPVPVRDIVAANVGLSGSTMFSLVFPFDGDTGRAPLVVEEHPDANSVGPLALLVDGTVWALLGMQLLPQCTGVVGIGRDRRDQGRLVLIRPGDRRLGVVPGDLLRMSKW